MKSWNQFWVLILILFVHPCYGQSTAPIHDPSPQSVRMGGSTQPSTIAETYEQFFKQVLHLKTYRIRRITTTQVKGRTYAISVPTVGDVTGLTDPEVKILESIAERCFADLDPLIKPRSFIFEAHLEEIESGRISDSLEQQIQDLNKETRASRIKLRRCIEDVARRVKVRNLR